MSGHCCQASRPSTGANGAARPTITASPAGGVQLAQRILRGTIHILRNHLTVIRGTAQLGLMGDGSASAQDFMEIIRACDTINDGLEDLISIGRGGTVPYAVDICKEIDVAVSYAEGSTSLSGARISTRMPDRVTAMVTDRRQLRLVLGLLIGVTAEETGWNGTIIVSAASAENHTVICIAGACGAGMKVSCELQTEHTYIAALARHLVTMQGATISELCKCRGFKIVLPAAGTDAQTPKSPVF